MPPQLSVTEIRLNNIVTCLTVTADTMQILASGLKTPFLEAISNTTQSLLKNVEVDSTVYIHDSQMIKQNKNNCTALLEQTYKLLNAVLMVHVKSDTGGELPPSVLHHIGKFTETLHKIHTFVEAQRNGSKVKSFFRQGEMSTLLKECKAGLQQGFIDTPNIMKNVTEMQQDAESRHKAVLTMIEALSDTTSSDGASLVLTTATQVELAALIGTHLGLKPGKDLTRPVIQHFSGSPPSLLILDNLETLWEPTESRANIEEFLSLLTGVEHLALVITMRGAERPAKVAWTRPFLQPLKPLEQAAARQTFIDIADNRHDPELVDKVLSLTDNMPLAINLLGHLVDSEGCSNVLSRWEEEKTSLISDGYDKRSNLDLSISLSLSSTRLDSFPHSEELLSLLSILPDGLSDAELVQAKLPIDNILGCKAALIRTTLAYSDEHKRLKALVPIREYMQKIKPPGNQLVRPLLKHFKELLELFMEYRGTQSSPTTVARISSNYSNIQNILWNGAQQGHPDLINTIYCACDLNHFSHLIGRGPIPFTGQIHSILPQPPDHHLEAYFIVESFVFRPRYLLSSTETLVFEALEHFEHFDDPDLKYDIPKGQMFCETAISLALSTQNTKMQSYALSSLAWIKWTTGDYSTAQLYANETQRSARISADLHRKAQALRIAMLQNMRSKASMRKPEKYSTLRLSSGNLYLREGNFLPAKTLFESCLKPSFRQPDIMSYCLERLGDASRWSANMSSWTTVFLVHSVQRREKLGIHKALQFLGDAFLAQDDGHTAINLFTVALEGFTYMDVHRSRAECMLRLGDISKGQGDLLKALELWTTARPLFEQSSQAKQVENIDQRLGGVSEDVLEQHRKNLAHLAELTAPLETVDEINNPSDIEDMDGLDLEDETTLDPVAL
ncbi:hypothetical protein B0H13DRAFT_1896478 [Mycena leptocephala]|nr:hypothetical protein B0H13DRAFT_1896478 [Mycena leptocephala]